MKALHFLFRQNGFFRGKRAFRQFSFLGKGCISLLATTTFLFALLGSVAYGDVAVITFPGTTGRYFLRLFALTPRELFVMVGALLGIVEGIFIIALVRTRKKCK